MGMGANPSLRCGHRCVMGRGLAGLFRVVLPADGLELHLLGVGVPVGRLPDWTELPRPWRPGAVDAQLWCRVLGRCGFRGDRRRPPDGRRLIRHQHHHNNSQYLRVAVGSVQLDGRGHLAPVKADDPRGGSVAGDGLRGRSGHRGVRHVVGASRLDADFFCPRPGWDTRATVCDRIGHRHVRSHRRPAAGGQPPVLVLHTGMPSLCCCSRLVCSA